MLERSSSIAYRYCPAEAAKALELPREIRAKFVAHYGLALVAAEWRASDPDNVARVMRERGLEHPRPRMSFPPEFLNYDQGIGAFSNLDEGVE
ncbi:MAG TPA: hypothetical protein VFC44_19925 [Candidatus Saccharimonadales bacterium]|nr:hypothetical protein [Candidatus Saccharimonadales bacterium]